MKDNWVGAIFSVLLVLMLIIIVVQSCIIIQLKTDYDKIKQVEEKVNEHDKIMKAYEFYNWHYSLKMFNEKE